MILRKHRGGIAGWHRKHYFLPVKKNNPIPSRRNFLSAFTSSLADTVTELAEDISTRETETPPYTRQEFLKRNRMLQKRACDEGFSSFNRNSALHLQISENSLFNGFNVAQGSLETALACLEMSREPELAGRIVDAVLKYQIVEPAHADYGNFRWMAHWDGVRDKNAVHFIVPNLCALVDREERLHPAITNRIRDALRCSRSALRRKIIPWAHTNMRLMQIWSMTVCGYRVDDTDLIDEAKALWDEWFKNTDEQGIVEYNSPCYTGISLFALEGLWEIVPSGSWRRQIELMLDYFTFELLIHTVPGIWCLGGAMSRSYHGHLDGNGWTTLYAHRHFGTRCPKAIPVWSMNFLIRTYRQPKWLHDFCWKRDYPYDVIEDHPRPSRHCAWPTRRQTRIDSECATGSQTGVFYPPQEVPYVLSYNSIREGRTLNPRMTIAGKWRASSQSKSPAWKDWDLAIVSDRSQRDTYLLLHLEPKVEESEAMEFVFYLGEPGRVHVVDEYEEENRDHIVPWPRGFRIFSPGPAVGIWIYEPVHAITGEPQAFNAKAEIKGRTGSELELVLSVNSIFPLAIPILIAVRNERKNLPLESPIANTEKAGGRLASRVSVPQTGTLAVSLPPTERPEVVLHRSRYLTLRPGMLAQLSNRGGRFQELITGLR